ncbi:MAG TPA: hypothetical protein VFW45_02930 [Candidatus Polarisedimenticolia bacterium]|nr:hypothetical protein [Candidatus Polarisedimenticolia bacterium]
MARSSWYKNTGAGEAGRWHAAARALVVALLLCLGAVHGWAQQTDPKPSKPKSTQKQANQKSGGAKQVAPAADAKPTEPKSSDAKPATVKQADPKQSEQQQMRGLDEQIQEIKSDVLSMSQELRGLEEKLLYPSGTQIAIFVGIAKDDTMRLDAVKLQIDGQLVAHYIYSAKELEALRKGGVQRIYVGNVATGNHKLEVLAEGKLDSGSDFSHAQSFTFSKEVKPKLVGLTLAGSGDAPIALGEW